MSKQPVWKFVANLGDANPLDYGGLFLFVDETGAYPPELEKLEPNVEDCEDATYTVWRITLDPCFLTDGVLSDNPYHKDHAAWFADDLHGNADCVGIGHSDLVALFTSAEPIGRANAYVMVADYHGWDNFDSYPLTGLTRAEAAERCKRAQ